MASSWSIPESYAAWEMVSEPKEAHPLSSNALQNLELATQRIPELQPGHSLVRIHAVSLNSRDLYTVSQSPLYPQPLQSGRSPCSDAAGIVVASSPGSVLREYVVVRDNWLVPASKNLSLEEAAALPVATVTAVEALLYGPTKLEGGEVVLTQGTGGVSMAAVQFASAMGCTVMPTSSSPEKLELARSLGAKHTVNHREHPVWSIEALRLTNGKGVDLVVDVGGSSTMLQSLASICQGGAIAICGILGQGDETGVVPSVMYKAAKVQGILDASKSMLEDVVRLSEKYDVHPVIAKVWDFKDAKQAFEMLMSQKAVGKVVIKVAHENGP